MSEEKKLKARVAHKHKTAAEWHLDVYDDNGNLRDNPFVPLNGELIIFDPEEEGGQRKFKFGDGSTNVIDLPFFSGTTYTETDPTVPAWAKKSTKPTYTAAEVGALPSTTKIPSKVSELTNDSGFITSAPVTSVNNKTGAVSLSASDVGAVPTARTVNGKALSSNITLSASDVGALPSTTTIPTKLSDLAADATHRVVTDTEKSTWNAKANTSAIPTKISQLTNDKGYITSYTETDPTVPSWAKASTKPSYTKSEVGLGNVDNVKQYSASNPPPYPVTKVNNKTGAVTLSASDVGADASGTASSVVSSHNTNTSAHADIRQQISQLSSEKVDKIGVSLGIASDGLIYVFIDGQPVGTGIPQGQSGDVFGYVDENNTIVLNGALTDGTYTIKYELENGSTVNIGNLVLDTRKYYSVTKTLAYCSINNSATSIAEGEPYKATITANDGYALKSVTVTMGGANVSVTNGVINIASVTGNIVINAVAEVAGPAYTNLLPLAVNADGSDFVGTHANGGDGYEYGYRISGSNGNQTAASGMYCTGFMPVAPNNEIYIKDVTKNSNEAWNNIVLYDSSKNRIFGGSVGETGYAYAKLENGVWHLFVNQMSSSSAVAFFRTSWGGITDDTIITVNQPIT